jgi:hypothetical protein
MFNSHRFKSRLIAVVTAVALAVQGFAPLSATAATSEGSLEAALKFICTQNGLIDSNPSSDHERNRSTDSCPLCPTFSTSSLVPTATPTPLPRQFFKTSTFSPRVQSATLQPNKTHILARAPPDQFV